MNLFWPLNELHLCVIRGLYVFVLHQLEVVLTFQYMCITEKKISSFMWLRTSPFLVALWGSICFLVLWGRSDENTCLITASPDGEFIKG